MLRGRRRSAPSLRSPACSSARVRLNDRVWWLPSRLQRLELLVTVLLARSRQPPPTVAAGVPHAELAAELVSLPSGLLAMVCEAIVMLKVRPSGCRACACVRFGCVGPSERGRRGPGACTPPARVGYGQYSPRGLVPPWRSAGSTASSTVSTLQVSDVTSARRNSERTGPLRRSSRLSTLRAGGSA